MTGPGSPGQKAFLAGLDAFHQAGLLHDFEIGKRDFIGGHGKTPVLLVQGPPGTGKSYSTAFAVFARLQAAMKEDRPYRVFLSCKTHAATDVLLEERPGGPGEAAGTPGRRPEAVRQALRRPAARRALVPGGPERPAAARRDPLAQGRREGQADEDYNADIIQERQWAVVGVTPGGTYGMLKQKWPKCVFGHELCDLLVLDEASQMNLPEAVMAALPMKADAQLIVVGDHRQMPPIVKHDWDRETRRTFRQYQVYESLFDTLRSQNPPMIQFAESFRLHCGDGRVLAPGGLPARRHRLPLEEDGRAAGPCRRG